VGCWRSQPSSLQQKHYCFYGYRIEAVFRYTIHRKIQNVKSQAGTKPGSMVAPEEVRRRKRMRGTEIREKEREGKGKGRMQRECKRKRSEESFRDEEREVGGRVRKKERGRDMLKEENK
jgi:hypothetical protein